MRRNLVSAGPVDRPSHEEQSVQGQPAPVPAQTARWEPRTAAGIRDIAALELSERGWMREIALQLAYMNEKKKPGRKPK